MGPFWRIYHPSGLKSAIKTIDDFVEPFLERAIAEGKEEDPKGNFTQSLAHFTTDRKVLRDQLVNALIAGRDTTAATLSWLFYELSYHPAAYAKLREEVINTLGTDNKPTYQLLKGMKYLQWCLNEGIVNIKSR